MLRFQERMFGIIPFIEHERRRPSCLILSKYPSGRWWNMSFARRIPPVFARRHPSPREPGRINRCGDYGENDQKEVQLEVEIPYEDLLFVVEGRRDGLIHEEERIMIDEIKSTSGDLGVITEHTYPVHWAQAQMYAYMYAKRHEIPKMAVRLTYFQVPSGERKQFVQEWSFAQLESFVLEVVAAYAPYANLRGSMASGGT